MPTETVPGTEVRYHLVAFDARGQERSENGGRYRRFVLREATATRPTDVFVFSHGWNSDVAEARSQYGRWIATMHSCADDRAVLQARPGGYRPLLVGLHWPSKAWSDEQLPDEGAEPASAPPGSTQGQSEEPDEGIQWLVDRYAALLTDTPPTRAALRTISTTDRDLGPADARYDFQPRAVYNLDADEVIKSGGGASGAHSDICHPELAHAVWQAVAA